MKTIFLIYYKNKEAVLIVRSLGTFDGCHSNFGAKAKFKIKAVKFVGEDPQPLSPTSFKYVYKVITASFTALEATVPF